MCGSMAEFGPCKELNHGWIPDAHGKVEGARKGWGPPLSERIMT